MNLITRMTFDDEGKYYFKVGTRGFVGHVWETNKGPALGYCRWGLYEYLPDLDHWYKHDGEQRPQTYGVCLFHLQVAIKNAREERYVIP